MYFIEKYLYSLATDKKFGFIAGIFKALLFLLSLIFEIIVRLTEWLYRIKILKVHRLSCKVISVGNITLGGTGKTPLIALLTFYLREKNKKVAISSRGYKKKSSSGSCVADEPKMLSNNFSEVTILVGRNRVANGKNLLKKENIDVMLLDDGFQHWRLHRDLDIVTIDCGNAFGNGRVLPRGILREPVSSLKRANIFVLTKTDLAAEELNIIKQKLKRVNSEALVIESKHKLLYLTEMDKEDKIPVSDLKDRKVVLLCSIADPGSFKKSVVGLGANIKNDFFFLDHHQYLEKEIDNVLEYCSSQGITDIITTEKDAVRLQALGMKDFKGCRVLVLYITLKITENEKGLFDRLHSACNI